MAGECSGATAASLVAAGFSNYDDLLAAALEATVKDAPANIAGWKWGPEHTVTIENPVLGRIPMVRRWAEPGVRAAVRKRVHGESSGAGLWAVGKIHCRLVGPRRFNFECGDRERRKFSQSLLHGPMERVVHGIHVCASIFTISGG